MTVAAYYQCYKQKEAFRHALKHYRKVYPTATCVLVNDGGYDYTDLAAQYNCNYTHLEHKGDKQNLVFDTVEGCHEYVRRFATGLQKISEKFVILMEDDVLVCKPVNESDLKFDINGCNPDELLPEPVRASLGKGKFFYGACGGSILNVDFFKRALADTSLVDLYCSLSPKNMWASDALLSFICYKSGGTVGQYPGFCETWYPTYGYRMFVGNVEVLHQYKSLYVRE